MRYAPIRARFCPAAWFPFCMAYKIGFIWRHMKPSIAVSRITNKSKSGGLIAQRTPTHHVVRRVAHCISIIIRRCNARIEGLHNAVRTHTRTILPRRLVSFLNGQVLNRGQLGDRHIASPIGLISFPVRVSLGNPALAMTRLCYDNMSFERN